MDEYEMIFAEGSVPVAVAAKVLGKDAAWVRAGLIEGWLKIGQATRGGKAVTSLKEQSSKYGRINYYISPSKLYELTGYQWKKGETMTKERYLELKRVCRNYAYYEDCIKDLYRANSSSVIKPQKFIWHGDSVYSTTAMIEYYENILNRIELAANVCGTDLYDWVLKGVTEGKSYDAMNAKQRIPCGRRQYYAAYKRYFLALDKLLKEVTLVQE